MGNCLRSETRFPLPNQALFAALRDGDFAAAEAACEAGADVNCKFIEYRLAVYSYPLGARIPCVTEVEYPGIVWYAGTFVSKKWLWRTYAVVPMGESWEVPSDARPTPEPEDGDTLLLIALKCNRRDVAEWLLKRAELDLTLTNNRGRDVRAIARLFHKEHLLSSRPEILTPELAALNNRRDNSVPPGASEQLSEAPEDAVRLPEGAEAAANANAALGA